MDLTRNGRVADVALGTSAGGVVVDGNALSVGAARLHRTRIATILVNTGLREVAVAITSTAVNTSAILTYL